MPLIKGILDKVLLLTIGIAISVAFILLFISVKEQTRILEQGLVRENMKLAEIASKSIETDYLIGKFPFEILKGIKESANILFWWLVKPNGEIYLANNEELFGQMIKDPSLGTKAPLVKDSVFYQTKEKIKLIVYPVRTEDVHKPWTFYLGVSQKSITDARYTLISKGLGYLSLILFLVSLLSFYLSKTITKPIRELRKTAVKIGQGEFVKAKIMSHDEVGDLAKVFNETTEALRKSRFSLEEACQRAEQEKNKTLAIITNFSDGLLVFDENQVLSFVNPRAEQFLEIKSKPQIMKSLMELLGDQLKEIFRKEFQVREDLILEVSTIPFARQAKKSGTLVILHNITREKMVEKLKSEFVSLSAHQLRAPLSGIKWTLDMFLDGDLGKITKEQKNYLQKSYQANERMIELINDLLNLTKIEEGKYVHQAKMTDFTDVVETVIKSLKEHFQRKKIKLVFKKPKEKLPLVMIDREKMELVLTNIFENALRYTLSGGRVTACLEYIPEKLKFSVKDTGIGIPATQQKRVFTKFFRATNAKTTETKGTGLGLFIVKNIITAHQGEIWFESKEGQGTTFYFTLPIKKDIIQ